MCDMSSEADRCCCLCVGSVEQLYYLVKRGMLTAAGEALSQLVAFNCSTEVRDNGVLCLCKACYNVVMRLKSTLPTRKAVTNIPPL